MAKRPVLARNTTPGLKELALTPDDIGLCVYAGVVTLPSYTDLGNGSVTIGAGVYNLYSSTNGIGYYVNQYALNGGTFALVDGVINYIYVKYNSGSPIVSTTTVRSNISDSRLAQASPIFTIFRDGVTLHKLNWGTSAIGLPEAQLLKDINGHRFTRDSTVGGLLLTDSGSQHFKVSTGAVWFGTAQQPLLEFDSSIDTCFQYQFNGSVWTKTTKLVFNNSQYQGSSGLVTLTNNRYAVNWIYRSVEDSKICYIVLGNDDYSLAAAQASQPNGLPSIISSIGMLVGRIIVKKGDTSSTQVDSAFSISFSSSGLSNHNDLTGRDSADCHPATSIINIPAGNIISTNIQNAINELDSEKALLAGSLTQDFAIKALTTSSTATINVASGDGSLIFKTTDIETGRLRVNSFGRTVLSGTTGIYLRPNGDATTSDQATLATNGTFSATAFSGSGALLTNLTASNLNGTIPSTVLGNSNVYIGTTTIALNRASASQNLTGITSIDGSAAKWTTARTIAGNSVDGSVNVPFVNKFIVQGTSDAGLSGAQFLGSLGTGLLKNTTTTGILSVAAAGTDYLAPAAIGTTVQAYSADLTAIDVISGTSGLLRKTATDTWSLDTTSYASISTLGISLPDAYSYTGALNLPVTFINTSGSTNYPASIGGGGLAFDRSAYTSTSCQGSFRLWSSWTVKDKDLWFSKLHTYTDSSNQTWTPWKRLNTTHRVGTGTDYCSTVILLHPAYDSTNIRSLTLTNGGSGYVVGDTIDLVDAASGTGCTVTVATLSGSAVATVSFVTRGGGYTLTDLTQASTSGSGVGATFTAVLGDRMPRNECHGRIIGLRGTTSQGHRTENVEIYTHSSYNINSGTLRSISNSGLDYKLVTVRYGGVLYLALNVPYTASRIVDFYFDGYSVTTGEDMLLVDYYNNNTSTVLNAEINSSITSFTSNLTTKFTGALVLGDAEQVKTVSVPYGSLIVGDSASPNNFPVVNFTTSDGSRLLFRAGNDLRWRYDGTNDSNVLLAKDWATPGTIGSTTPNTGNFTYVNISGSTTTTITKNTTAGLCLYGITGSSYDFSVLNPSATQYYLRVPTGTNVPEFPYGLTAGSILNINPSSGSSVLSLQVGGTEYGRLRSYSGATILSNAAGTIYLRPNGDTNNTGAASLDTAGLFTATSFAGAGTGLTGTATNLTAGNSNKLSNLSLASPGDRWGGIPYTDVNGVMEIGKYIDFHETDAATSDYDLRLTSSNGALVSSGPIASTGPFFRTNVTAYHLTNIKEYSVANNVTGTLKITLPVSWNSTMMRMRISGYEYFTGIGAWEVEVGGYNYTAGWINTSATVLNPGPFGNNIRLAHDGTYCCILLGTTSTVWHYPKVVLSELSIGHGGYSSLLWRSSDNYTIETITDESGLSAIASPTVIGLGAAISGTTLTASNQFTGPGTGLTGTAASLSIGGNAGTATTLATARTINSVSFNGSANITVEAVNPNALTLGTGLSGTSYDGSSAITAAIASNYSPNTSTDIVGSVDLNTYQTPGFWHQTANAEAGSGTNYPTNQAGSLNIYKHAGVTQHYTNYHSSAPEMWFRNYYNSTWSDWAKILHSINSPSLTAIQTLGSGTTAGFLKAGTTANTWSLDTNTYYKNGDSPSFGTVTATTQFTGPGTGLTGTATSLSIGGNANTATTSTNLSGATINSIPYQSGSATTSYISPANYGVMISDSTGVPSMLAGGTGVLVGSASAIPTWSSAPALTGTNFSSIPTSALTLSAPAVGVYNSSINDPLLWEIGLEGSLMDAFKFNAPTTFETNTSGTWTAGTLLTTPFDGSTTTSATVITSGMAGCRWTWRGIDTRFFRYLMLMCSTSSQSCNIVTEYSTDSGSNWTTLTTSPNFHTFPGRLTLKANGYTGSSSVWFRLSLNVVSGSSTSSIVIYKLAYFRQFPMSEGQLYSWDYAKNVTFSNTVTAPTLSGIGTLATPLIISRNGTSGNLNIQLTHNADQASPITRYFGITSTGSFAVGTNSDLTGSGSILLDTASNPDLVAIEALSGASGFLKKTAANTWSLDTNTYYKSGDTASFSGLTVTGARPIVLNGTTGALTSTVSTTGGWANALSFILASDSTTLGAFGGYGGANAIQYLWIGSTYGGANTVKIYPATGELSATSFTGAGTGLTSIPNTSLTNSSMTIGSTELSLGGSSTTFTGLTALSSAAATALSLKTGTTGALTIDSGTTGAVNIGTGANAKTITIGNTTGATGLVINSGSAGVIFNQTAAGIFKIAATAIPTTDMVQFTNAGYGVTTAEVNALNVTYVGGAAAVEAGAMRIDITPGTTASGIWNALRIVPTAPAATSVVQNGLKFGNITAGTGTDNMLYAGTGWDNILSYNGTSVINGTGNLIASQLSGTIPSAVLGNSSVYIGTTAVALNRASAALTLVGITLTSPTFTNPTLGTVASGTWNGSVIGPTYGGTGQSTWVLGEISYASAANTISKLSGNITTTKKFLSQTGTGTISAAPTWEALVISDIPTITAAKGGTGQTSYTIGDIPYASASTTISKLSAVAIGSVLVSKGVGVAPAWSTALVPFANGAYCSTVNAITAASTTTINASLGNNFKVTGTATINILNITNLVVGQVVNVIFVGTAASILTPTRRLNGIAGSWYHLGTFSIPSGGKIVLSGFYDGTYFWSSMSSSAYSLA